MPHSPQRKLRVLALHSFRTSAAIFQEQLKRAGLDKELADLLDLVSAPHLCFKYASQKLRSQSLVGCQGSGSLCHRAVLVPPFTWRVAWGLGTGSEGLLHVARKAWLSGRVSVIAGREPWPLAGSWRRRPGIVKGCARCRLALLSLPPPMGLQVFVDAPNAASGPIPDDVSPFFAGPYFEW